MTTDDELGRVLKWVGPDLIEISEHLTRNGWRVSVGHDYIGAALRLYRECGEKLPDYASDYLFRMIVLSAHCYECGAAVARLCTSPNLPHANHPELARYAFWVPVAHQASQSRCSHEGFLPDPSTLVSDVSRSLKKDAYYYDGDTRRIEGKGRVKVRPARLA